MEIGGFVYQVRLKVTFTKLDLQDLYAAGATHYAPFCSSAFRQGGCVYRWSQMLASDDKNPIKGQSYPDRWLDWYYANLKDGEVEEWVSFRELDLMCKVWEMHRYASKDQDYLDRMASLRIKMGQALSAIRNEDKRIHRSGGEE